MLSETDFGKSGPVPGAVGVDGRAADLLQRQAVRLRAATSAALDGVGGRAERLAGGDLPPELPDWLDTLGQDNVRSLSVMLLIDLLDARDATERAPTRSRTTWTALAEDLLLSGAYDDARVVTRALGERADVAARSAATPAGWRSIGSASRSRCGKRRCCSAISTTPELATIATHRRRRSARASIEALKPVRDDRGADAGLAARGGDGRRLRRRGRRRAWRRWPTTAAGSCSATARGCSGASRTPDAVPLLQPLLRKSDPRVARAAVSALGAIDDPSAARAIHTVLRSRDRRAARAPSIDGARRRPRPARRADAGADHRRERAARQGSRGRARDDRRRSAPSAATTAVPPLRPRCRCGRSGAAARLRALKERGVDALVRDRRPSGRRPRSTRRPRPATGMLKKLARIARLETACMEQAKAEELVRRLAAALRGAELYSPTHPLVQRGIDASSASTPGSAASARPASSSASSATKSSSTARGCRRGTASLVGFARDLREREIEKITLHARRHAATRSARFVAVLGDRKIDERRCRTGSRPAASATSRSAGSSSRTSADDQAGHRGGATRLRHRRRDGRDAVGAGEGRRPARPRRRAQDHRRPRPAGDARTARR